MLARLSSLVLAFVFGGCGGTVHASRAHATTAPLAKGHTLCPQDDLSRVVTLVNQARKRGRLRMLGTDAHLARFASTRSAAMAAERRLSHSGWERALRRAGLV